MLVNVCVSVGALWYIVVCDILQTLQDSVIMGIFFSGGYFYF